MKLGLVTQEQLLRALDTQERRSPSILMLAVEHGAMNHETALRLLDQRQRGDERPFELIAQDQLWLTRDDIDVLYAVRAKRRPRIGEMLVRLGYITRKNLNRALEAPAS